MSRSLTLFTLLAVLSVPAAASAQGQPPPPPPPGSSQGYMYGAYGQSLPGHHEHEGFFFRFGTGLGYTAMAAEDAGTDITVSGAGGPLMLAFGFNVAPNFIIYGEGFASFAFNPTIEIDGDEFETEDLSAGVIGAGVGLAYYLRSNLYFSGTLGAAQLSIQADGEEIGESQFGPAFSGQIGYEWWVSSNWGLGVAGQLLIASMKDSGGSEDVTWGTAALSVLFSATYD